MCDNLRCACFNCPLKEQCKYSNCSWCANDAYEDNDGEIGYCMYKENYLADDE